MHDGRPAIWPANMHGAIGNAIKERELQRNPIWTQSIAVGSKSFVERVCDRIKYRVRLEKERWPSDVWSVREPLPAYTLSK